MLSGEEKSIPKGYILYDSIYIKFLKWQSFKNGKQLSGWQQWGAGWRCEVWWKCSPPWWWWWRCKPTHTIKLYGRTHAHTREYSKTGEMRRILVDLSMSKSHLYIVLWLLHVLPLEEIGWNVHGLFLNCFLKLHMNLTTILTNLKKKHSIYNTRLN